MAHSDADAIQAVLNGDVDRYAELVDRYHAQALRVAFAFLGDYEEAKDASQEAFVSAYQSLDRFRGRAQFSTWLYRIIVNKCKDAYRRRARQPAAVVGVGEPARDADEDRSLFVDVEDPTASPSDQLAHRELSHRLSEAIGDLPMQQRTAFTLHHLQGLSLDAVAEVMGCRLGSVKSHIFRATQRLRAALSPYLTQEGC